MAKGKGAKKATKAAKGKKAKGKGTGSEEKSEEPSVVSEDEEPSESEEGGDEGAESDPEAGSASISEPRSSKDVEPLPGVGDGVVPATPLSKVRPTLQPDPADDHFQSMSVPVEPKLPSGADDDEDEDQDEDEDSESEVLAEPGIAVPLTTRQIVKKLLSSRLVNKKLIDIINPKKEPLPVDLPPISDIRKQAWIAKGANKKGSRLSLAQTASAMMKAATVVPFIEGDDAPNPFQYPASIEEFIAKNDADRLEDRRKAAKIPPLMKGTVSYKQSQVVLERIKPFILTDLGAGKARAAATAAAGKYKQVIWRAQNGLHVNHLQKVSRKLHTEYILQRKGVYYLRRAIRARKIALEMISKTREFEETCLKDYEWLTDFTKEAFETFLKENDDKTHEAAHAAEDALKEKLDLTLQVRQMNIALNQIKSEIIGTNESLRECKAYMRFLDDIASEVMKKDEEAEIRAQHRELQVKEELMVYLREGMDLKEAQELVEEKAKVKYEEYFANGKHRSSFGTATSTEFLATLQRDVRRYLGMPDEVMSAEDEPEEEDEIERDGSDDDFDEPDPLVVDDDGEDEGETFNEAGLISPKSILSGMVIRTKSRLLKVIEKQEQQVFEKLMMAQEPKREIKDEEDEDGFNEFALLKSLDLVPGDEESDRRELASLSFTRPSQLLQIYTDMEESNLSLIQHSQASEENLERVNYQIVATRKELNQKGKALREEINRIQANIDINEDRANALAMLVEMFTGGNYDVRQQQKLYKILQKHVARVYRAAVGTTDHHLNPIMMLTSIEKNFEDLMHEIQAMPTDVVVQISRELDKERREMERLMKMGQRKKVQEERKSRQLDRAQAPIPRRKGRQLLPRSRPPKVVIELSQAELDKKAEEDEFNYFFGP